MSDLHAWLTAKVNAAEITARQGWTLTFIPDAGGQPITGNATPGEDLTVVMLRRCEADRRILRRHRLDPDIYYEPACEGCRVGGADDMSWTDNLNDCPELLDLAHAHGITDEELADLDRPKPPERPTAPKRTSIYTVPAGLRGPLWPGVKP